jgi:hypothetical protein
MGWHCTLDSEFKYSNRPSEEYTGGKKSEDSATTKNWYNNGPKIMEGFLCELGKKKPVCDKDSRSTI